MPRTHVFCIAVTLALTPQPALAAPVWQLVAQTGETAPGTDRPFIGFDPPTLNERGDIAFLADIPRVDELGQPVPCPRSGIGCILPATGAWRSLSGEPVWSLVAPDQALPVVDTRAISVQSVVMNRLGSAAVLVDSTAGRGIYRTLGNELQPVAVLGEPVGVDSLVFSRALSGPLITDSAELLFEAYTTDPTTNRERQEFWVADDNSIRRGPPIGDFRFGFSHAGKVGFARVVIGEPFDRGVYIGDFDAQQLIFQTGESLPRVDSTFFYPQQPSVNDRGQFVVQLLHGSFANIVDGEGLWAGNSKNLANLFLTGDIAPGTTYPFESFSRRPSINSEGEFAFSAFISNDKQTSDNRQGLWQGVPGDFHLIALQGENAPGTDASFDLLTQYSSNFVQRGSEYFAFNNRGQVAFVASLTGSDITLDNDTGLWAQRTSGEIVLIIREGDLIEVAPDDIRQVASFIMRNGAGAQDTYDGGFTDLGHLALSVGFTDGSAAILINSALVIPEPATITMGSLLSLLATFRRRQC